MQLTPDLSSFPLTCIYGLKSGSSVYPCFSLGNSLTHLSNNITLLRRGIHDCKQLQDAYNAGSLELVVFKEYNNPPIELITRMEIPGILRSLGLSDMTGYYDSIPYAVKTRVFRDYRALRDIYPLAYVTIQSRSVEAIVLGIFESVVEAESWMSIHYPGGVYTQLVFCDNTLTKGYHDAEGYKLIRFKKRFN